MGNKVVKNREKYRVGAIMHIRGVPSLILRENLAIAITPISTSVDWSTAHYLCEEFAKKHKGWRMPNKNDFQDIHRFVDIYKILCTLFISKEHDENKYIWLSDKPLKKGYNWDYDLRAKGFF